MTENLLPCPFCGSPNVAIGASQDMDESGEYIEQGRQWTVLCSCCGASSSLYSPSENAAAIAWNTRRDHAPQGRTAQPDTASEVFDWLDIEVSAIDIIYRGSPTYVRDAEWMKDEVLTLLKQARKAFETAEPAPTTSPEPDAVREALEDCLAFIKGDIGGSAQKDGIIKQAEAALSRPAHGGWEALEAVKPFAAHGREILRGLEHQPDGVRLAITEPFTIGQYRAAAAVVARNDRQTEGRDHG